MQNFLLAKASEDYLHSSYTTSSFPWTLESIWHISSSKKYSHALPPFPLMFWFGGALPIMHFTGSHYPSWSCIFSNKYSFKHWVCNCVVELQLDIKLMLWARFEYYMNADFLIVRLGFSMTACMYGCDMVVLRNKVGWTHSITVM